MRRNWQSFLLMTAALTALLLAAPLTAAPADGGRTGASSSDAQTSSLVAEEIGGTILSLTPQIGYQTAVLRISGPGGYSVSKEFDGNSVISLELVREVGRGSQRDDVGPAAEVRGLADGRYRYEVVFTDGSGQSRVHTGGFLVENGMAVSAERRALGSGVGENRSSGLGQSLKAPKRVVSGDIEVAAPTLTNVDDTLQINDTANDDRTQLFMESECSVTGCPSSNWRMDNVLGDLQFIEFNLSAPSGATRVTLEQAGGQVGIGTTAPARQVHVESPSGFCQVRMSQGASQFQLCTFDGDGSFQIQKTGADPKLAINADAPNNSLRLSGDGIGAGTSLPDADFHLTNVDGAGDTVYKMVSATGNWNIGVRASNGVFTFNKVGTPQEFTVREANNPTATLDVAGFVRGTAFKSTSSRALKTAFEVLDGTEVLATLAELPVTSWRYKTESEEVRHYGPVAEDFQRLFGLGDGKTITGVDADGVLMAAVQGLNQQLEARGAEIAQLEQANAQMKQANADLEARLDALEARLAESQ